MYFEGPLKPPLVTISGGGTSGVFNHTGSDRSSLPNS
jgi:hypothetical protein